MKKLAIITTILLAAFLSMWQFIIKSDSDDSDLYLFVEVKRGNVERLVTSTGTIEAVRTIDVGTQVSGIIEEIFVDFNDRVSQRQLIAVLDTAVLVSRVRESEAALIRAQAQYNQAVSEHKRNLELFEKEIISEQEFVPIRTNVEMNRASLQTAQISLDRALTNLQYAEIRSPIDGIIIQRNVDPGQTVAASFSTPTLFIVAEDLSQMQILATVDESDIGQVMEGQEVLFTVPAYPDVSFSGTVRQIRLQPTTIQNVVNYTVVVDATNKNGLLLPGMTATVDFVIEKVENVLVIPNGAIRFEPPAEIVAAFRENMQNRTHGAPDSVTQRIRGQREGQGRVGFGDGSGRNRPGGLPKDIVRLWFFDENGELGMKRVRIGATDGLVTEIKTSRGIVEGMKFISGIMQRSATSSESNTNISRRFRRGIF